MRRPRTKAMPSYADSTGLTRLEELAETCEDGAPPAPAAAPERSTAELMSPAGIKALQGRVAKLELLLGLLVAKLEKDGIVTRGG